MKTLLVLRHGKSDWDASYGRDHDRPLAPRGVRAAARVGRFLERVGWPNEILSSTAVRARNTVELACREATSPPPVQELPSLYGAGAAELLLLVGENSRSDMVMTAGHEPTCSEVVQLLTGARCRFPTAALARIDLPISDWRDAPQVAGSRGGTLRYLVTPRILE